MHQYYISPLLKAENPEAYKKLAQEGTMVAHPVTINGQANRPDNGIGYHATVKFFDPAKDHAVGIHSVARDLKMIPPDPEQTGIEPSTFKDRFGNDVHVLKLHGEHADQMKEHNSKFAHMGFPSSYEFAPHVSVDKQTWDGIVASGAKTAKEAGIAFGHAELRQGHNVVTTYKHGVTPTPKKEGDKLAASEQMEGESLAKGMRQLASAAAIASVIGLASPNMANPHAADDQPHGKYDSGKMLRSIAQVESSGGKFTNHRMMGGKQDGAQAYGKYGLMPNTIRETVRMNKDLKGKYGKAQHLDGTELNNFMQDNPGLEDKIAEKHLARLEHHFGHDPAKIGYAWLEGISGGYKAQKENSDIQNHWHVKKVKDAYGRQQ